MGHPAMHGGVCWRRAIRSEARRQRLVEIMHLLKRIAVGRGETTKKRRWLRPACPQLEGDATPAKPTSEAAFPSGTEAGEEEQQRGRQDPRGRRSLEHTRWRGGVTSSRSP